MEIHMEQIQILETHMEQIPILEEVLILEVETSVVEMLEI